MSAPLSLFSSHRVWCFLLAALLMVGFSMSVHANELNDSQKELLGIPRSINPQFKLVATSPNENYTEAQQRNNAPDILSLEAAHIGEERLLFRVKFAHPTGLTGGPLLHIYLDLDNNRRTGRQTSGHQGVDVRLTLSQGTVNLTSFNSAYSTDNAFAGGILVDDTLYVLLEAPLHGNNQMIHFAVHLLAERWTGGRQVGNKDSISRRVVELPRNTAVGNRLPVVDWDLLSSLTLFHDYRFINSLVKYESLENKGIPYHAVAAPGSITFGRERPLVPFASEARRPNRSGAIARHQVPVTILEEAGTLRQEAPISFGFPLPQGAVYDLAHFRLVSPQGEELPAQFTATSFWPDDSLKWVLIDFTDRLEANEERTYTVEFGHEVRRAAVDPGRGVMVEENADTLIVTTGPLRAQIGKNTFKLFDAVWIDRNGDGVFSESEKVAVSGAEGVGLVNEHGVLYTASAQPPESVRIEQSGNEKIIIRVEGKYGADNGDAYMRYVTRFTFRADSTRVDIAHTLVNDYLETEFTDYTSLYIPIETPAPIERAEVFTNAPDSGFTAHSSATPDIRLFQRDEKTTLVNDEVVASRPVWTPGMTPGVVRVASARSTITTVIHDFQERWPKGLSVNGQRLILELFPEQPDEEYGTDLPYHLMFPFVSGKYRSKWGNSFTDRITIDFAGDASPEELAAEGRLPAVAVIPPQWYNETKAFGAIATSSGERLEEWDRFITRSFSSHMSTKSAQREFGYFNYGDWFGERGRNWGNNEYDLAHGLFMEFVRTGKREYYRLALAAARHQADVDIIHASPDPAYLGANAQHSIGHTGVSYQRMTRATWSKSFDVSFAAANGHTWADGMMDAWYFAGDPRVMEAALSLGEHIAWSMAPNFRALGSHERTAGWSLKALTALYRGTYDPVYLDAARHIANVALREQDLHGTGVWPHKLPSGHDGNRPGAIGNNLYLIGILLSGLQSFHAETGDPAILRSLEAAVKWVVSTYDPDKKGWPYSAPTDGGGPLYDARTSLNSLVIPPLAYVGAIRGNNQLLEIAGEALAGHMSEGTRGDGKSLAVTLHFASEYLARLAAWDDAQLFGLTSPRENQEVSGNLLIKAELLRPDQEAGIQRVTIDVGGEVVYSSNALPKQGELTINSEQFEDGNYTVTVIVEHKDLGVFRQSRKITLANRWSLVQSMAPPLTQGWFGQIDFLKTSNRSDGWTYGTTDREVFFGDAQRLIRNTDAVEYLEWETPRLQSFEVVMFVKSDVTIDRGVEIALSRDGKDWAAFDFQPRVEVGSHGWNKIVIQADPGQDVEWNWFKLTVSSPIPKDALQIGNIRFDGFQPAQ